MESQMASQPAITTPQRTETSSTKINTTNEETDSVATQKDPIPTVDAAEKDAIFNSIHIDPEDSQLIEDLFRISKKSPKLVRSTAYTAPADPNIVLRSWKMNEFKYYDVPSPFPTLARGLFTQEIKKGDQVKHRIVARGYDKFFNIGEVPWTHWASLESHTGPPYTLTLKSNGCIIFIAALTPTKLVVTSKHALGPSNNTPESHAQVGERWLRKHLADAGKTEEQLAKTLWDQNLTAVAELCDDSFEEHVLPYGPDLTGLHLHGLNECTKRFRTMDQPAVDAFAREWGFIVTKCIVLHTVPEVKAFTEEIGRTGKWDGESLEGFVVRTRVVDPPTKGGKPASASPYAPGSSFFFKVKFDEPYMMYRDWREVTKSLLSKGPLVANVPKGKLRRPETRVYVDWVIGEIRRDKSQFDTYARGKGIIATRERFLKWLESNEGRSAEKTAEEKHDESSMNGAADSHKQFGKTIIVPVAVPGVGKTSVAVALCHLFGFGHMQSDDVKAKKPAPVFIKNVVGLLKTHDVVIADKNNHLKQHRQQLREATANMKPPVRLLALNWSFDVPLSTIHRICADRITERGENHQALVAGAHETVVWQFLKNAEELTDDEVDVSVEMEWEESLEDSLARVVDACVRILGVQRPDQEKFGEALAVARGYRAPTTKRKAAGEQGKKERKEPPPRYYGILAEVDLEGVLGKRFKEADAPQAGKTFWERLAKGKRVAARPHVTVVHSKALPEQTALWELCRGLQDEAPPLFSFRLGHVVWNERIMAATVVDFAVSLDDGNAAAEKKGLDFVLKLPTDVKDRMHITVGTRDKEVAPVEARSLVWDWKQKGDRVGAGVGSVELKDVWVKGRVKGLIS
ncbi:RNA ligase-domain-containing protein [Fomitopsis serialis]|uniref:RNA ligase-domain-containing protein n=1 Tax=Fomitopsis serialis TaxID=139415 RepID=UPI00200721CF|nr:RNA ligase-domain-containing protein [Neoantrodia serialis]KAH9932339.1 RNA ligase-domain-containing protein [Neoantrodia serialis]